MYSRKKKPVKRQSMDFFQVPELQVLHWFIKDFIYNAAYHTKNMVRVEKLSWKGPTTIIMSNARPLQG